ncbi:type II secretion system protein [Phormidesmis priestleyi ULC007]|uniref:Type II secretion system protein n=1 Tax=Phormidesmis priestleyi ULC007 TaxID=1920490 RepID=A0A2T1DC00_9CYAN|nr:type II secretion system protein [Phormidesmis priestleyi]PSB17984.1 type II secretion system protein [Phormidesmis priestleyi ULC007]PZO49324.1 MAG: type II secretion system protein [Phormidesmis priestleyi]
MKKRNRSKRSIAGFTLIEALVVIIMAGILFAIAAPSWVGFLNRQRLSTARGQVFEILRSAQADAKRTKVSRAIVFDNTTTTNQQPRVIVVPVLDNTSTPSGVITGVNTSDGRWQVLGNGDIKAGAIKIAGKPDKGTETDKGAIIFDTYGNVNPNIGATPYTITIQAATLKSPKRCVKVTTLLGAMTSAEDGDCN